MSKVRTLKLARNEADEAVKRKYPCIALWGRELLSMDYYIVDQCYEAEKDGAPRDAIYKDNIGNWHTAGSVKNDELRARLLKALETP